MKIHEIEFNQELYDIFSSKAMNGQYPIRFERLRGYASDLNAARWESEMRFVRQFGNRPEFGMLRFFRNLPVANPFIGDFVDLNRMIIVEIDGSIHNCPGMAAKDKRRERFIKRRGWTVIRLNTSQTHEEWEVKFKADLNKCLNRVRDLQFTKREQKARVRFLTWISKYKTGARISHDLNKAPTQLIEVTDNP